MRFPLPAVPVVLAAAVSGALLGGVPTARATVDPAPRAAARSPHDVADSFESSVLRLINRERTSRGLRPLAARHCPDVRAEQWARHMAATEVLSHQDLRGLSRCPDARRMGENIAMGYPTPKAVVSAWMHSPDHRANILQPRYSTTGLGVVRAADGTLYYSQTFVGRR